MSLYKLHIDGMDQPSVFYTSGPDQIEEIDKALREDRFRWTVMNEEEATFVPCKDCADKK